MKAYLLVAVVFFLILIPLGCSAEGSEKNIFMLSSPLKQIIKLNKPLVTVPIAISATYATSGVMAAYHLSHGNLKVTALVAAYQYLGEIPVLSAQIRSLLEVQGRWSQFGDLQEIANLKSVNKIHIFTTGYADYKGLIPTKLNAASTIFVEAAAESLPDVKENHWILIKKPEDALVRMQLKMEGNIIGESIEISLQDFLNGEELNVEKRKNWGRAISTWKKTQSLLDRFIFQNNFMRQVSIRGSLFINGKEYALEEVATGQGTKKIINPGFISNAYSRLKYLLRLDDRPTPKLVRSIDVLSEPSTKGSCATFFQKLWKKTLVKISP